MSPDALGARDAYRDAASRILPTLTEAERAAATPGLAPADAAYVAARCDTLRRIVEGLRKREKEQER